MARIYDIGPFQLDADLGALTRASAAVALSPRAVAVLTALAERAHQFVPKCTLMDAAWPGVIVEESNLAVQVHAIRRVLAGAPGGEHWIETLPKRGYRFVGPVTERGADNRQSERGSKRSNLPEPLTSFVGRERDLMEIKRLLPTRRLVTIVGVGGIGKTRLALQAAAEVIDAYRDGVWLAELGSIRDPALVPTSVAQALGVQEAAGTPITESLPAHLNSRQLLLILDNCEHLLDACAAIADRLLRGTADVTILATSRELLRVAGEQTYHLHPLALPELGASTAGMERSGAVQLFVDRVQRQLPDFSLTTARAPAVAQICIHLDGIPLALELAAARARTLSVEQINARLGDRFRLLTDGTRTALPRQQTLRAALDWSYDLLPEVARTVLSRLSIFAAGFTVEAASAVASGASIDEFAVIDVLSQLVARSLVIADTGQATTRYRLLETTRAYAKEKLAEMEEADAIVRRHAQYFCGRFERAPEDWLRVSDAELRARYLPELDDVRAALAWALAPGGDPGIGIVLAGTSGVLWGTLGLVAEGAHWLEAALALVQPETPASDQAQLWLRLGRLVDETPSRAHPALVRAADMYRRLGDEAGLCNALVRLGRVLALMGSFEQADAVLDEAHSLIEREVAPPGLLTQYFFNRAFLSNLSGDLARAREDYEQSLALFRRSGDENGELAAMGNLANVAWALDDLDATEAGFRHQIALLRESPMKTSKLLGWALANLAGLLIERRKFDEASAASREGLPLLVESGSVWMFVLHDALRSALAGNLFNAARLAGYSDHMFAANGAIRSCLDARTRDPLNALLRENLAPDELERLRAEGAKLTELEACRLALED